MKKTKKWIIWLLFLLPMLYLGMQIWRGTQKEFETQIALSVTVRDSIIARGVIVRDESRLDQDVQGVVDYTVSDTERVSSGYEIAQVFQDQSTAQCFVQMQQLESRIAILQQAQQDALNAGTDVSLIQRQLKSDVSDYISMLQSGSFTDTDSVRDAMEYSFNKMDIAVGDEIGFDSLVTSLQQQVDSLRERGGAIASVYTPISGYFCYVTDGLEELSDEEVRSYSASQLQDMIENGGVGTAGDALGKVISSNTWSFYCVLPQEKAERLKTGQKVTLGFNEVGVDGLAARVAYIGEPDEDGNSVISVNCDSVSAAVSSLRFETAEIILATYTGARIPRTALHLSSDGEPGVYIKYGTIIKFCYIRPVLEQEQFITVALDETVKELDGDSVDERSGLRLYDEIIVSGLDLYKGKLL